MCRRHFACWITKSTDTHLRVCNIYCFSTATMFTRKRLGVTFVLTLPALFFGNSLYSIHLTILIVRNVACDISVPSYRNVYKFINCKLICFLIPIWDNEARFWNRFSTTSAINISREYFIRTGSIGGLALRTHGRDPRRSMRTEFLLPWMVEIYFNLLFQRI